MNKAELVEELQKMIFNLTNVVVKLELEGVKRPVKPRRSLTEPAPSKYKFTDEDERELLKLGMPFDGTGKTKKSEAKQMAKYSDGSFRVRPNGLLEYRFYDESKTLKSVYGRTEQECFDKRTQVIKGKYETQKTRRKEETFGAWLSEWFTAYKSGKVGDSHKATVLTYIEKKIKPALGAIPLKKLDGHQLQAFFNGFSDMPNTQKKLMAIVSPALQKAQRLGKIKLNPADVVELQEHDAEHYRALEFDEQNALLTNVSEKYRFAVKFLLCTGIRKTKAFELNVDAIDFEHHRITVVKKQKKGKNQTYSVPFLDELFEGVALQKEGRIFDIAESAFTCHMKRIYKTLGINHGANIHSLRHSFVSTLYNVGAPLKKIQAWAGHNTFDMTSDVYCHLMKEGYSYAKGYLDRLNQTFSL